MRMCFSVERERPSQHFQGGARSIVRPPVYRKHDKVCDGVFLRDECQLNDDPGQVVHGQDGSCDKPHERHRKDEKTRKLR